MTMPFTCLSGRLRDVRVCCKAKVRSSVPCRSLCVKTPHLKQVRRSACVGKAKWKRYYPFQSLPVLCVRMHVQEYDVHFHDSGACTGPK